MSERFATSAPADPAAAASRDRRLVIVAIFMVVLCSGAGFGLSQPLIALDLERRGYDTTTIGLMSSCSSLAAFLMGPVMAGLLTRFGATPLIAGGFSAYAVSLAVFPLTEGLWLLVILRLVQGAGFTIGWILSESLLNHTAGEGDRGRLIGWYAAMFMSGMALGPAILMLVGSTGMLPFLIGAAIVIICLLIVLPVRWAYHGLRHAHGPRPAGGMLGLLWLAPVGFVGAIMSGAAESIYFSLLPLYGLGVGLAESDAVILATAFAVGAIVFQVPIGWLADRMGRLSLLAAVMVLVLAGTLAMAAAAPDMWLLLPTSVLCGGAVGGLYTVGLIVIGDRFAAGSLVLANSLFIMSYTTGTIAGPPTAGLAMTLWPPHGFIAVVVGMQVLGLVLLLVRQGRAGKG